MSPSVIEPESASCSVAMVRISVDLPAPFGPSRPNMPVGIVSETSCSALTPLGYVLDSPSMRSSSMASPSEDRCDPFYGGRGEKLSYYAEPPELLRRGATEQRRTVEGPPSRDPDRAVAVDFPPPCPGFDLGVLRRALPLRGCRRLRMTVNVPPAPIPTDPR